jgi:hypothetical protein
VTKHVSTAALFAGCAFSAWVIPGQWLLILGIGAGLGFGSLVLTTAGARRYDEPGQAGLDLNWGNFEANLLIGAFALSAVGVLWALFRNGFAEALYSRDPALASGAANTAGMAIGLTLWTALNRRKLISK